MHSREVVQAPWTYIHFSFCTCTIRTVSNYPRAGDLCKLKACRLIYMVPCTIAAKNTHRCGCRHPHHHHYHHQHQHQRQYSTASTATATTTAATPAARLQLLLLLLPATTPTTATTTTTTTSSSQQHHHRHHVHMPQHLRLHTAPHQAVPCHHKKVNTSITAA